MTRTPAEGVAEILRRAPLELDKTTPRVIDDVPCDLGFADDHEFVVALPKWVFDALKRRTYRDLTNLSVK